MYASAAKKIKVAVLYGGCSGEHEVSRQSATAVINHLDKNKFEIIPIEIDQQGGWHLLSVSSMQNTSIKTAQIVSPWSFVAEQQANFCDVWFPVLHGSLGEDGAIQGLLEMLGVPYVGANVLGSAIGMDKEIAKRLAREATIPILPFLAFNTGQWLSHRSDYEAAIQATIAYPLFVKPANTGSSLGISKVKQPSELAAAVERAFQYDTKILVEPALMVREIEVAVLESLHFGLPPEISCAGEIVVNHEFYSYEAKYLDEKAAELMIPAKLSTAHEEQIKHFSVELFRHLATQGMARIDFFIDSHTQAIYFNEINTIPGFTKISMYPKLWEASGRSYADLLTHLITLALQRAARTKQLKRSL